MSDTIESLRKQLAEAEENLRLIQERRSEYVQATDIPIQLIKDERRLEEQIADLRKRLEVRQEPLTRLYKQLQDAAAQEHWSDVLALGEQIQTVDAGYRSVPNWMARARKEVHPRPRPVVPTWAWVVGGVAVVALLVILGNLAFGEGAAKESTPTTTPTHTPTVTALATTPTTTPTQIPTPTSTPEPAGVTNTPEASIELSTLPCGSPMVYLLHNEDFQYEPHGLVSGPEYVAGTKLECVAIDEETRWFLLKDAKGNQGWVHYFGVSAEDPRTFFRIKENGVIGYITGGFYVTPVGFTDTILGYVEIETDQIRSIRVDVDEESRDNIQDEEYIVMILETSDGRSFAGLSKNLYLIAEDVMEVRLWYAMGDMTLERVQDEGN